MRIAESFASSPWCKSIVASRTARRAAFAAYGAGRVFKHDGLTLVGADLVRAQLMAEALAIAVKQTTRRDRPSGSGFSFPSGHTTATLAAATVLQRHFGSRYDRCPRPLAPPVSEAYLVIRLRASA